MARNLYSSHKAVMGRDLVLGIPQSWFIYMIIPLGLAMTSRVLYLALLCLPLYGIFLWGYKKDIYWVEIVFNSIGQADRYRA